MDRFANENRLLLSLAGTTSQDINNQTLFQELNWDYVCRTALANDIAPLIYQHLEQFGDLVPSNVQKKLAITSHAVGFHNQGYLQELKQILTRFSEAGIKVIVLKGGWLLERVYKNIASRKITDIDLLIKKDDFIKANAILAQLEYYHDQHSYPKEWFGRYLQAIPHQKKNSEFKIDLHWNLQGPKDPFSIDIEEIWERRQQVRVADSETYTLSVEDTILFSCYHSMYSHYLSIGLKAFCDLAEIIKHNQEGINWSDLGNYTHKYRMSFVVFAGLWLTRKLIPSQIPEEIFEHLESDCSKSQLKWLEENADFLLIIPPGEMMSLTQLRMITGIKDKLKFTWLIFFPPVSELAIHYSFSPSNKLLYLYYSLINLIKSLIKAASKIYVN